MKWRSSTNSRLITKGLVAIIMLMVWFVVIVTGLLMWAAPRGHGLGSEPFILGLTRHDIGEFHLIVALIAVAVTIVHVCIDWKAFKGLMRYMIQAGHQPKPGT